MNLSVPADVCVSCCGVRVERLTYSHVATWADKYLDSGVSLVMDAAESSGSDSDIDGNGSSVDTLTYSSSCIPSDVEVSTNIGLRIAENETPESTMRTTDVFLVCRRHQKSNLNLQRPSLRAEQVPLHRPCGDVCQPFPQRYDLWASSN